jgi:hypothetical protein
VFIFGKETSLPRLRIAARDLVFVYFENFNDDVALLHGQPDLIDDPGVVEGTAAAADTYKKQTMFPK